MELKDSVEEFIHAKAENRILCNIVMTEEKKRKEQEDNSNPSSVEEEPIQNDCFNLEKWMNDHPKVSFKQMCNFDSDELDELVNLAEEGKGKYQQKERYSLRFQCFQPTQHMN